MIEPNGWSEVIAVTGLLREARIASRLGATAIAHGGHEGALRRGLAAAIGPHTRGLLSFGIAGSIHPDLRGGATVIADEVIGADMTRWETNNKWRAALRERVPDAIVGSVAAESCLRCSSKEKLFAQTGALIVDQESVVTAQFAAERGLPFAVFRVILDDADTALPPAAKAGLSATGRIDFFRLVSSLFTHPFQARGLVALGRDSVIAFAVLERQSALLGPSLDHPDFLKSEYGQTVSVHSGRESSGDCNGIQEDGCDGQRDQDYPLRHASEIYKHRRACLAPDVPLK
jgi:adenosylhomocysteine nucleosidase